MGIQREVQKGIHMAWGVGADWKDRLIPHSYTGREPSQMTEGPTLVFDFWYAPRFLRAKALMEELHRRFASSGLPIGVGLFVRPMGDVYDDFSYNPESLISFLVAAASTSTKVFINTCGMQWSEVSYRRSPLLRKLEESDDNLMKYENGSRVRRKIQPPGNILHGLFGSDRNGVLYLSHNAPDVKKYRERNLRQMAQTIKPFADSHPDLFLGISTEKVDYPGEWITGGLLAGYEDNSYEKIASHFPPSLNAFRISTVKEILRRNVNIFTEEGLPKIYTNQSVEDAATRASPLSTTNIPGSNIGITAWWTGNNELYRSAHELAYNSGKGWALVVANPRSLSVQSNLEEIRSALYYNPDFIGFYNWWPHFLGYGIRGLPLETAIQFLTKTRD